MQRNLSKFLIALNSIRACPSLNVVMEPSAYRVGGHLALVTNLFLQGQSIRLTCLKISPECFRYF